MPIAVDQQNCGNCYFGRNMPRQRRISGPNDANATISVLSCCLPAPGTMANPPTVIPPWREVEASYWCGQWSDTGLAEQGPPGPPGPAGPAGIAGNSASYGIATIDFGAIPTFEASLFVDFQTGIPANAHVRAWIQDDVIAAELVTLTASGIVAGSGFTLNAASLSAMAIGTVPVHWVWNP